MRLLIFIVYIIFCDGCKQRSKTEIPDISLQLSRPSLNQIDSIEKANHGIKAYKSYKVTLSSNYFPDASKFEFAEPILFVRDTSNSKAAISYFYSEKDSTIRLVEYSWSLNRKTQLDLNKIFEKNQSNLTLTFKNSGEQSIEKKDSWTQKTIVWQNDDVYVKQFIFSGDEPHRVRVLVSWK